VQPAKQPDQKNDWYRDAQRQSKRPRPIVISVVGLHTLVWVVSEAPQTCFAHCGSAVVWVIFDVLEVSSPFHWVHGCKGFLQNAQLCMFGSPGRQRLRRSEVPNLSSSSAAGPRRAFEAHVLVDERDDKKTWSRYAPRVGGEGVRTRPTRTPNSLGYR
jgi:hypothetical protein